MSMFGASPPSCISIISYNLHVKLRRQRGSRRRQRGSRGAFTASFRITSRCCTAKHLTRKNTEPVQQPQSCSYDARVFLTGLPEFSVR